MEIRKIRQLAKLLQTESLEELELQDGDSYIKLTRAKTRKIVREELSDAKAAEIPEKDVPEVEIKEGELITSPISGTFYRCKAPGVPPYVSVNEDVVKGQTLCILEAMKLMNELEASTNCKVIEILVEDAQAVSEGQALFRVLPAE